MWPLHMVMRDMILSSSTILVIFELHDAKERIVKKTLITPLHCL